MRRRPEGRRLSVFLVEERLSRANRTSDARRQRPCKLSKSSALASIVLVPAEGFEPPFARSELAVLAIGRSRSAVNAVSGLGENRTLTERLRGACSTFELRARGSHRNRTCLVSVKSRLHHLGANDPSLLSSPELPALACVSLRFFFRAPGWNRTTQPKGRRFYRPLTAPAAYSECVFWAQKRRKPPGFPGGFPHC